MKNVAPAPLSRRSLPEEAGRLDQAAIDEIRRECWPDIRDEHELHDLLHSLVVLPIHFIDTRSSPLAHLL